MKPAGTRPAIRSRVDCFITVFADHAPEFAGDQIKRALPRHGNEPVSTSTGVAFARTVLQPPFTYRRSSYPTRMVHHIGYRLKQRRRVWVMSKWACADQSSVDHSRCKGTPMGTVHPQVTCVVILCDHVCVLRCHNRFF